MNIYAIFALGGFVGIAITLVVVGFFLMSTSSIKTQALTLQLYCEDRDCYECEFMKKDGTCRIKAPLGWRLDDEEETDERDT